MMKKGVAIAWVVLACQSVPLHAENRAEAKVRATVNALLGEEAVRSVAPAPLAGLYEVVLRSGELVYTNEQVSHIVVGSIIDAKTRENLTEKRQEALARIDFSTLPLNDAIVIKSGDGSRILASFEDPNCGFCKRLAKDLQQVTNTTQYLFLYPILGADSTEKARRILSVRQTPLRRGGRGWSMAKRRRLLRQTATPASLSATFSSARNWGLAGRRPSFLRMGRALGGISRRQNSRSGCVLCAKGKR